MPKLFLKWEKRFLKDFAKSSVIANPQWPEWQPLFKAFT
jgi:hypothetical protein